VGVGGNRPHKSKVSTTFGPLHSRSSSRKCKGDEGEEKEEADREAREREVSVRLYAVNVHSFLPLFSCEIRLNGSAAKNGEAPK
jgi:hypothetical protein